MSLGAWFYIILAVALALLGNALSAMWASGEDRFSVWLWLTLLVSPLVFISFGLVTSKVGLSIAAGTVDALLTIATIGVGLFLFQERSTVSPVQCVGIALAVLGIFLMLFFPKPEHAQ
jgi:multidrug transporter EmrE-like cation transporter